MIKNKIAKKNILTFIFLLISSISFSQNFKFALVTDTHLVDGTTSKEDLERTISSINNNKEIEFVIVNGDITEEGDYDNLALAENMLETLNVPFYATSGNHETKWSESGTTAFNKVYGSDRFEFEKDGVYFIGFNTGPVIRMMDGHIGKQDLIWLNQKLDSIGSEKPVIVATHYPLQDGDVDNWYDCINILKNYNTKVVLNGHYHSDKSTEYDGIPAIINRSNLRAKDNAGGYNIYSITPDSIIVEQQIIGQATKRLWSIAMNSAELSAETSYPDFSINEQYPNVKTIWEFDTKSAIYSAPLLYKGMIYTGDYTGNIFCISEKTGELIWEYKTQNKIFGSADAKGNIVVIPSTDDSIYALNTQTGRLIWKNNLKNPIIGGITIEGNTVYVGGSSGHFYALDLKTGKIKWDFDQISNYVETKPLIYKNMVLFGAWDSYMYALNKKTGKLIWKWNNGRQQMHFSPAAVWPAVSNNKLFFSAPDRFLTALDVKTGKEIWRTNESMVRETIGISKDGNTVFSKTMQDYVVAYDATSSEPKLKWKSFVGYGYDHAPTMPQEKDGVLFGTTKNGIIFGLDANNGEVLWKHKIGNTIINTVVPLSANECIFSTADGLVGKLNSLK